MSLRKTTQWLALLIVIALVAAACSDASDDTTTTAAASGGETTTTTEAPAPEAFKIGVAFPGDAPYLDGYRRDSKPPPPNAASS